MTAPIATLFDFDGVLVDSEPVHLAAFNDVLAPRGVTISQHEYDTRYIALDDAGVFRAVLTSGSLGPRTLREEEVRQLVAAKAPRFMARFEESFRTFPGAAELVARRAGRGPVGVVSGALLHEIEFALRKMGVRDHVRFVVSAESPGPSKPDPAPFVLGVAELRRLGHAGPAVVIEDSTGGVTAAKRAGLRCVGVAHSAGPDDLRRAGADAVAADLAAL